MFIYKMTYKKYNHTCLWRTRKTAFVIEEKLKLI